MFTIKLQLLLLLIFLFITKSAQLFRDSIDYKNPLLKRNKNSANYQISNESKEYFDNNRRHRKLINYMNKSDRRKSKEDQKSIRQGINTGTKFNELNVPDMEMVDKIVRHNSRIPVFSIGNLSSQVKAKNTLSIPNCGLKDIKTRRFIVNGGDAVNGTHPWIAGLFVNGVHSCSANIISEWWALTVAHCVNDPNPDKYFIRVGSNNRLEGTDYKVTQAIRKPEFGKNYGESDIALLKINGPIVFNRLVRPICLPNQYQEFQTRNLIVAGWGYPGHKKHEMPIYLKEVTIPLIPIAQCAQKYQQMKWKVFKSQMCTFSMGKDACQADSGGPAVVYSAGKTILVGLVSAGHECADTYPGVFTKVSYFRNWIQHEVDKYS